MPPDGPGWIQMPKVEDERPEVSHINPKFKSPSIVKKHS